MNRRHHELQRGVIRSCMSLDRYLCCIASLAGVRYGLLHPVPSSSPPGSPPSLAFPTPACNAASRPFVQSGSQCSGPAFPAVRHSVPRVAPACIPAARAPSPVQQSGRQSVLSLSAVRQAELRLVHSCIQALCSPSPSFLHSGRQRSLSSLPGVRHSVLRLLHSGSPARSAGRFLESGTQFYVSLPSVRLAVFRLVPSCSPAGSDASRTQAVLH